MQNLPITAINAEINQSSGDPVTDVIRTIVRREVAEILKQRSTETLSRDQVCSILNISNPTLLKWCKSGVMPYLKIGRNVRFYRNDIENFLTTKGQRI